MIDRSGECFVCSVAQKPWEDDKNEYTINQFCGLLPIASCEDGAKADLSEFPYNGQVFWKLSPQTRGFAIPGQLVTGRIMLSMYADTPGKDHYQVVPDSIELNVERYFRQIIRCDAVAVSDAKQLLSNKVSLRLEYIPAKRFWVQWREWILGPFQTHAIRGNPDEGWTFGLATAANDGAIVQFRATSLSTIRSKQVDVEVRVSKNSYAPHNASSYPLVCRYRLVEAQAFDEAIPADALRLVLESEEAIVRRLSKNIVGREKKRQFVASAEQLIAQLAAESSTPANDLEVLRDLKDFAARNAIAAEELARAILETGLLNEQIQFAKENAAREYVDKSTAALQTQIDERIRELRHEEKSLESECQRLRNDAEHQRKQGRKAVETEMRMLREEKQRELDEIQTSIEKQKKELGSQRSALRDAADSLIQNRQQILTEFLVLAPMLEQFGLLPQSHHRTSETLEKQGAVHAPELGPIIHSPSFVNSDRKGTDVYTNEEDFLDRFHQHVENCGFRYRDVDRLSFHTSVKCGDITIVGGPPGTGKSSLVRLYAEALIGSSFERESQRFLHVPVSPSWLDNRDVIGHINSLESTFQPSESGIYQFLLWACEEFENYQNESGMYVACLDEMNLSHVEHYFSSFIQVLEQPVGRRWLQCFPDNVLPDGNVFSNRARLNLPKSLKFVGTVNFDETTKQLSQRLLDRANLIRLIGDRPATDLTEPTVRIAAGERITLRNYTSWVKPAEGLPSMIAHLVDELRDPLRRLGCPLNPRTYNAIRIFISNYPGGDYSTAIDLQLTQRVFSKLRAFFRPGIPNVLSEVMAILVKHEYEFPLTLRMLEEIRETEVYGSTLDMEPNQ